MSDPTCVLWAWGPQGADPTQLKCIEYFYAPTDFPNAPQECAAMPVGQITFGLVHPGGGYFADAGPCGVVARTAGP